MVFLWGLGGLVGKLIGGLTDWLRNGMETLIDKFFQVAIETFLHIQNPYGVQKANEAWMNTFHLSLAVFPVMIILGLLSMPFADEQKTSLWRQGLRIVGVIAIIATCRPLIGFGVDLSNAMTTALMPQGSDLISILLPGDGLMTDLSSSFSAIALILIIYFLGIYMAVALGIVLILLQLRTFFIYLVYIASPLLAVFWYADWGLLENVNEFANKWSRMGIYTLLSGPIIAIIFRTMYVLADGALMQGADGAVEGVAAFWSHFVLVTSFPIIMIAAVWKIISWAGEPIGAGQAMTGMTMAFGAAIGAAAGSLGESGSAASGAQSGKQAANAAGSGAGGGGGGGASGSSGGTASGGGSRPGVASESPGTGSGQGTLADAVRDQDDATVSADDASGGPSKATASASGAGPKGGVGGDVPGGTGGSEGPSNEVTGSASGSESGGEPQGYINAAKDRYSDFKERNAARINDTVSSYKESAKDRLNPTNIERMRAQSKRQQAQHLEQSQQQFDDAIDADAGEHGAVDLAQAEEAGALNHSSKATNFDTESAPAAELNEDGTFQYRNENDEMVTESVGSTRQQFRDQKNDLLDQADAHEERADSLDQSMSETTSRLKKTGGNVKGKYGPAVQQARQAFGQEAVRGTVGAHSPYLMAGGSGVFGGGQRGGGDGSGSPDVGSHEHEESTNRPETAVSASDAARHQETLSETGERFDAMGEELEFEPGGGRTPDGVAQQGYLKTADDGETVGAVEVGEDSDVSLPSDESFQLGNVQMGKRDGSNNQSLPQENGEYNTFQLDEHSRLIDENEARVDETIGNDAMVGEEAQYKDMLIREADSDPESYAAQYYGESPTGERLPINAEDEEAKEALDDHVGDRADVTGTVENEYGMSTDTHPEYEGAHDYAALNVSLGDEDEASAGDGSAGEQASSADNTGASESASTATSSSGSSHSVDTTGSTTSSSSESTSGGHSVSSKSSNSSSKSGRTAGPTEEMAASDLTGDAMDDASGMSDYPDNADVSIPDDAKYEYVSEPASHETQKSKGSFKLVNDDEVSGDAPEQIGAIGFNGGAITDENGNPELNANGDPKTMPEDGDWNFDSTPESENPVIEGQDLNDVQPRHFYDGNSEHAHDDAGKMAAEHGGESNAYAQVRPSEETDMSGHTHTGTLNESSSGTVEDGSSSKSDSLGGDAGGSEATPRGGAEPSSSGSHSTPETQTPDPHSGENSEVNETSDEPESTSGESASASASSGAGASEASTPDYGATVEASEKTIPTEGVDNVDSLDGERVDARGVGGTDIINDAQLESSDRDSDSRIQLADQTRETEVAEYGEGRLENIEKGDSFEIQNGEVAELNNGTDVLQMDEETVVEETAEHEGDPTVSLGSDRSNTGSDHDDGPSGDHGGGGDGGGSGGGPSDGSTSDGSETSNHSSGGSSPSADEFEFEHDESDGHRRHEGGSSGTEHSVSTQQVDTGGDVEEVKKGEVADNPSENKPDEESESDSDDDSTDSDGEPDSGGGDGGTPPNPGSGSSTAGAHSGSGDDSPAWENRARNWREHQVESESGAVDETDPFTAESMQVATFEDGEQAYITDYDDLNESLDDDDIVNSVDTEELKHQSLAGHEWTESMGQDVPNVAYNEDENELVQQEAGGVDTETWSIGEAPDEVLEEVDRDDYEETMAVQLLGGNLDTGEDNVHVTEDGDLQVIDFDRTASEMGQVDDPDEMEINAGAAGRVGSTIGEVNDDFHTDRFEYETEVTERATEIATELEENGETEEVLESVETVDEQHSGETEPAAPLMRHNIKSLADSNAAVESDGDSEDVVKEEAENQEAGGDNEE